MSAISDILYMVLGGVLLILTLSGTIRMGPVGVIASLACIGFGAATMWRLRLRGRARSSDLLADPQVVEFYRATQAAWAGERLDWLGKNFAKEGRLEPARFVRKYPPVEGKSLHVLFARFKPEPGEYLVALGDPEAVSKPGWFALTDRRLIQRDGVSGEYREIRLDGIDRFEFKGAWTKSLAFFMKDSSKLEFAKVEMFPAEKALNRLMGK